MEHRGSIISFPKNLVMGYDKVNETHLSTCIYLNFKESPIRNFDTSYCTELLCLNISSTRLHFINSQPLGKLVQLIANNTKFTELDTSGFAALEILDIS